MEPGVEPSAEDVLSIGDVSRRTGVAVSALRYYEELGLIASERNSGNQRRYRRYMIRRVALITVAKQLGISLADVQETFAELPLDEAPTRDDWNRASTGWKTMLEARRREIERLERELTGCIGCGCLSMTSCSLLNPGDRLAEEGTGARRVRP